jgi:hypothetical protein
MMGSPPDAAGRQGPFGRSGMALLLVLALAILILSGASAAMIAVDRARLAHAALSDDDHILDGLLGGEAVALTWLRRQAATIVLPPDGGGIPLLCDRWRTDAGEGGVQVTLFDGLSGVPLPLINGPLRGALPASWQSLVVPATDVARAHQTSTTTPPPGADPVPANDLLERVLVTGNQRRYPAHPRLRETVYADDLRQAGAASDPMVVEPPPAPSLAEVLAIWSDGRVNINTAPKDLLRTIYQSAHLGGIDDLIARRGRVLASQAPTLPATFPDGAAAPVLVDTSDRWQILITASWNRGHRSWLTIVASIDDGWRIIQRHVVDD